MGLFFKKKTGDELIDNSEEAVLDRLDYLRYREKGLVAAVIDEEVLSLPRKIDWEVHAFSVAVSYSPFNFKRYKHIPEFYAEVENMGRKGNWSSTWTNYEGKPYTRDDYMGFLARTSAEAQTYFPQNVYEYDKENILIPYDEVRRINGKTDSLYEIPADLAALGLKEYDWKTAIWLALRQDHWHGNGDKAYQYDFESKEFGRLRMKLDVGVRLKINGVDAFASNLTYKEKQTIREAIDRNMMVGSITSDGKEDIMSIRMLLRNSEFGEDEDMAWYINSQKAYGDRLRGKWYFDDPKKRSTTYEREPDKKKGTFLSKIKRKTT